MGVVIDLPAVGAIVAAIGRTVAGFDRVLAVQRFGEGTGE